MRIRSEVNDIRSSIINDRRDIHKHPELGFQEFRTAELVTEKLKSFGIQVETEIGKTGVVGTLKGDSNGPIIALRADMDALPIQEVSNVSYKSIYDGVMHACGHDGHTAILMGVAKILSKWKSRIHGTVKFLFQPSEEGEGGAQLMIEDGAIKGVDEIYGLHLWNPQALGTVGVKYGPVMAAADGFEIIVKGKSGHGGMPQGTVDSVLAASHMIVAFQSIVSRNTDPLGSTVVTVGKIEGGSNFNVISDNVKIEGTTRAYTEENRLMIKTRINEIISGTEKMFNAEINMNYWDGYPPTINEKVTTKKLRESAKKIVGDGVISPYLSMGGEDFSYYLHDIPGCYFFIGSSPDGKIPLSVPHHCSHFDIDEKALLVGASVYVQLIEDSLVKTTDSKKGNH